MQTSLCHTSQNRRPNTDVLYPLATSGILPNSTANVLHPQNIAHLLQQYPNRQFVETLISIAISGVRIGYEGSLFAQTRRSNHTSAFTHPEIITNTIQSEIKTGWIKEIENLPVNYYCSSIDLVPKSSEDIQIDWRTIFDLSSPDDHSVNDGIPKEYGTIIYETLDNAIRLIAQAEKGAVMMKRDLKSAFHHVPINPCDY